ncbi:MAG TPA: hypothetical protein VED20_07775, partial [Streptosporangiaceae bacterium]|nr:hypothetical protein [Streptosporangiaceae bacterium]
GEAAWGFEAYVWGSEGRSGAPAAASDAAVALRTALAELTSNAGSGQTRHPCDVRFGRDVGHVLAASQRQIEKRAAT